jgi:hypothetical protein
MAIINERLLRSVGLGVIGAGCVWALSSLAPLYNCNGHDICIGFLFGTIVMGAISLYTKLAPLPMTGGE